MLKISNILKVMQKSRPMRTRTGARQVRPLHGPEGFLLKFSFASILKPVPPKLRNSPATLKVPAESFYSWKAPCFLADDSIPVRLKKDP